MRKHYHAGDPCRWHMPMNEQLGYIQHHHWMEEQIRIGNKQTMCPDCKLWFFPCEWGHPPKATAAKEQAKEKK